MAHRYASDPGEAEDIAQDALLRAWRRRGTLRDIGRRREWLTTIVRNEAFRHHARIRPEPVATMETFDAVDYDGAVDVVERADLQAALRRLDAGDRQLLVLRYGKDLTQAAIARLLSIPEGTVKVRLHRARNKLRRAFDH